MPTPSVTVSLPAFSNHEVTGGVKFTAHVAVRDIPDSIDGHPDWFLAIRLYVQESGGNYVQYGPVQQTGAQSQKGGDFDFYFVPPNPIDPTQNARLTAVANYIDGNGNGQVVGSDLYFEIDRQ